MSCTLQVTTSGCTTMPSIHAIHRAIYQTMFTMLDFLDCPLSLAHLSTHKQSDTLLHKESHIDTNEEDIINHYLDISKECASDDAAATPHQGNTTVVQVPLVHLEI